MPSKYPSGSQFILGHTRFWTAKRGKEYGNPVLLFQRAGHDLVGAAEFYSASVADSFIDAVLMGLADLPKVQLAAVMSDVEAAQKGDE
jgi:hypothetical protein